MGKEMLEVSSEGTLGQVGFGFHCEGFIPFPTLKFFGFWVCIPEIFAGEKEL